MRIVADEATRDRYRGCLLGGAIGAAKEGLEGHVPLALFTAEGLLRGWVRFQLKGIGPVFGTTVAYAYARWAATQGLPGGATVGMDGWLIEERELWEKRPAEGAGAMVRVGPVGMFGAQFDANGGDTRRVAREVAALRAGPAAEMERAGELAVSVARELRGERTEGWGEEIVDAASGYILGARRGEAALTETAPLQRLLEEMADDLAALKEWSGRGFRGSPVGPYYLNRYPPG